MSKKHTESKGKILNIDRQSKKYYPSSHPETPVVSMPTFRMTKVHQAADPAFNRRPYAYLIQAA